MIKSRIIVIINIFVYWHKYQNLFPNIKLSNSPRSCVACVQVSGTSFKFLCHPFIVETSITQYCSTTGARIEILEITVSSKNIQTQNERNKLNTNKHTISLT